MHKYIYLVGKSDPQHASIAAIRQAGFKVGLFADKRLRTKQEHLYDSVVPLDFANLEAELTPALQSLGVAGLLCTYENYVLAKADLAEYLQLPALSPEAARLCTDKLLMRQAFTAYDPAISPAFCKVTSLEEALDFAKSHGYPLILKPTNLVKSLLVLRCANETELKQNVTYAQAHIAELYAQNQIYGREPQLIIEQYITGTLCSVAAFVDHTGQPHFCAGVAKLVNAGEVGHDDNFLYSRTLPATLNEQLEQAVFETADKAIRALGLRSSAAHVELIHNEAGVVKVVEVGARIGGYRPRMYELSYGLDLPRQEVALALGKTPQVSGAFRAYSAVYELFPKHEGVFKAVVGTDGDTANYAYFAVKAKPGTVVGPAKHGYKAVAIVIVSSADQAEFRRQCAAAEKLHVEVGP